MDQQMLPKGCMRLVKDATWSFLCEQFSVRGVSDTKAFLTPYIKSRIPVSNENEFLEYLVHHSYNRAAGPTVVGLSIRSRRSEFDELVCHYDPQKVIQQWDSDGSEKLYQAFVQGGLAKQLSGDQRGVYWRG